MSVGWGNSSMEKICETLNKPVKYSMNSQQNFFNHLLNEIQFLLI